MTILDGMSRFRRISLALLGSLLAVTIGSFTLVPNRASDAIASRWLATVLEHPVVVEGLRLRSPTRFTCDSLRIGSPSPFPEATLLELANATIDGGGIRAAEGRARVERRADGATTLRRLVENRLSGGAVGTTSLVIDTFALESVDAATGSVVSLRSGSLVFAAEGADRRLTLSGKLGDAGADRPFEIRFEYSGAQGDGTLSLTATDLDLYALATVARAFDPNFAASGTLTAQLESSYSAAARHLAISGSLRGTDFSLLCPALGISDVIGERSLAFDGSAEFDFALAQVRLDHVKLDSQALAMSGDGVLAFGSELRGDIDLDGALNLDRAALKYGAAIARYTPLRSLRGTLAFRVARTSGSLREYDINGEAFTIALANGRVIDPNEFRLDGTFETKGDGIKFPSFHFDSRFLELRGTVAIEHAFGDRPSTGQFDLAGEMRSDKICEPVLQATIPLQLQMVGDVQVRIASQWSEEDIHTRFSLEGPRFGAHYDQQVGKALVQYDLYGSPLELELEGKALRSIDRFWDSMSFEGRLAAKQVKILRDELDELDLPIRCDQGKLTLGPFRSGYNGGTLAGSLELAFAGVPEPTLEASFELINTALKKTMPHRVAAMTTGVFVGELAPFRIETDCVANGHFEGRGSGTSILDILRTLNGSGELQIGKGSVKGSRLLEAMSDRENPLDQPLVLESIHAPFVTRNGVTTAAPVHVEFEGRSFELTSICDSIGLVRVVVQPESFFGADLHRRLAGSFPVDAVQIRGMFDEPKFQIPDRRTWSKLPAESLAPAVESFLSAPARN